jgi:hypothetical protein
MMMGTKKRMKMPNGTASESFEYAKPSIDSSFEPSGSVRQAKEVEE